MCSAIFALIAFSKIKVIVAPDTGIADYLPVDIKAPYGSKSADMQVLVPTKGEHRIANADQLFEHVKHSWDTVVESNQAGLSDPKQSSFFPPGLSKQEAWHHYQAGEAGVVDSARFLITFSMVPSVQSGGSPLHIAASLGNFDRVQALLDDGARVDVTKYDGTTPLHCAATMGHANVVKLLIAEGAFVEAVGNSGATPLMMAVSMGNYDAASALLTGGANPDTKHAFGKSTALHFAAEVGRSDVVRLLCQQGANVEAEKSTGGSPLHSAADANQTEVVRVLVKECGANINKLLMKDTTPLYLAAQRGFTQVVSELIDLGASINYVMPRGKHGGHLISLSEDQQNTGYYPMKNTEIGNGATALHAAVENGHLEAAKVLLEAGAVQSDSMEGATPLIIALQYKHPRIALLLLEDNYADPDINAKVPVDGSSALFVASGYGYTEVVKRLIELDVNLELKNNHGMTSLSHAIARHHQGIASLLLEAGAQAGELRQNDNAPSSLHAAVEGRSLSLLKKVLKAIKSNQMSQAINAKATDDQTPLHLSIKGPISIVKLLLDHGADVNCLVKSTLATPLHMAALQGREDVAKILLEHGANLEPRGSDKLYGATPLYLASQNGNLDVVKVLLEAGADVNCRLRKIGITPLFIASERGHADIVSLLLEHNATPRARNWNGVTALGVAAMANQRAIVIELLNAGAEVNSRDNEGNSILMNCIGSEKSTLDVDPKIISLLFNAGADPNLANKNRDFPLRLLAEKDVQLDKKSAKLAKLLLNNGARVNEYIIEIVHGKEVGQTALEAAIKGDAFNVMKVLLEYGADVETLIHAESDQELLPLGLAVKKKNIKAAKLLFENGARHCSPVMSSSEKTLYNGCVELAVGSRNFEMIEFISSLTESSRNIYDEL